LGLTPAVVGVLEYGGLPYRYAYAALLGLTLALHAALPADSSPKAMTLGAVLAAATASMLPSWSTTLQLWQKGYDYAPGPHTACGLFKALEARARDAQDDSFTLAADQMLATALMPPPSNYCCYSASRWFWTTGRPRQAIQSATKALESGCSESPELLAPMAISMAVTGDLEEGERWAKKVDRDPTGLVPVVLSAAALERGDDSVLRQWLQADGGADATPLQEQVNLVIERARAASQPNNSESPTP
jgi:hypothetical protein